MAAASSDAWDIFDAELDEDAGLLARLRLMNIDTRKLACVGCGMTAGGLVLVASNVLMAPFAPVAEACINATAFEASGLHAYEASLGGSLVCVMTQAMLSVAARPAGALAVGLSASVRIPLIMLMLVEAGREGRGPVRWPILLLLLSRALGLGAVALILWLPAALYGSFGGGGVSPARVPLSVVLSLAPTAVSTGMFALDTDSRGWAICVGLLFGPALVLLPCLLWPFPPPGSAVVLTPWRLSPPAAAVTSPAAAVATAAPAPAAATAQAAEAVPASRWLPLPLDERDPGSSVGAPRAATEPESAAVRSVALLAHAYVLVAGLVALLYVALVWRAAHTFGSVTAIWSALRDDSAPAIATTLVDATGLALALLLYALALRPAHATLALLAAPLVGPGAAGAALLAQRERQRHRDASDAQGHRGAAQGAEVELL